MLVQRKHFDDMHTERQKLVISKIYIEPQNEDCTYCHISRLLSFESEFTFFNLINDRFRASIDTGYSLGPPAGNTKINLKFVPKDAYKEHRRT